MYHGFNEAEQSFANCMSKRGQHPKLQDLLENVRSQINCCVWLDEHSDSDDKGPIGVVQNHLLSKRFRFRARALLQAAILQGNGSSIAYSVGL